VESLKIKGISRKKCPYFLEGLGRILKKTVEKADYEMGRDCGKIDGGERRNGADMHLAFRQKRKNFDFVHHLDLYCAILISGFFVEI